MRTILPFASDPLHLQMASVTTAGPQDHLVPPIHQDLSRSATPQQPDLSLLVSNHHASLANGQPTGSPSTDQTIQSILEVAQHVSVPSNGPPIPWNSLPPPPPPENSSGPGPSTQSQRANVKRRLEDSDAENPHNKIRRVVQDHVSHDPARVMPMTTVICLHAAVAQKSYGTEKRFLCPPPVVHIEGPVWNMKNQQLAMAVLTEAGERSFEQKAPLDQSLTASFKFLHVSGTAKTKSFQLSLDIAEPPATSADGSETGNGRIWASFDSAPVTIISKPSKKTAKTRSVSSCILAGGPVSLFNRINSQTVRTKYMTVDSGQLCASNVAWSAFNVNVVSRPPNASNDPAGPGPQTVLYGSKVILSDTVTGTPTPPLFIRKVDKGRIATDDGGPVSQMQKIALQRVNADGTRHYLSAAGPMSGQPGVPVPPTPGLANQTGTHPLLFSTPRVREEVKDNQNVIIDEVDDYLCWTIVGISKFQYTFFDAFGQNSKIPDLPITPFPTLFTAPVHRFERERGTEQLELTASNFFYENPATGTVEPLDVYLGPIGPLHIRIFHSSVPVGQVPMPFIHPPMPGDAPIPVDPSTSSYPTGRRPPGALHGPLTTTVLVDLPHKSDVMKALEEDAVPPAGESGDVAANRTQSKVERLSGRSLPLLFIRAFDGVGYHSGRAVACEYIFKAVDLLTPPPGEDEREWVAEQAAQAAENNLNSWAFRVL
ncbi:hypothetical protein IEO21_01795 [Rhodonia placenta]|uniref:Uncharacterized protein n=1 Tax=Rhodonia placenta TaxID=104341 RepID=A0A8H7P981_9APHY|nr:hypothetical protein IEO21_01795 [Postia placenta]